MPIDTLMPIAVLVNGSTASASEITCGTLQDFDRGVVIGTKTYGKGLVQQSRELPYKSVLKLTTGKYYIPSGRCVQAYEFRDGVPVHRPDSLCKEFRTAAGRSVYDGGGIKPDVELPADSLPRLLAYLQASTQLFDYCVRSRARHPRIANPLVFALTDDEYADFRAYMKQHQFTYDRQSLRLLDRLREVARIEGYADEAQAELHALEQKLRHNDDFDFVRWEAEIRRVVEASIIESYYYDAGRNIYLLQSDKDVQQAVEMMNNRKLMHILLIGVPVA